MDRRNRGEILFAALQYAKLDRQEMANGSKGTKWHKEALADIAAFERIQMELFGTTQNGLDAELDKCETVSISDIRSYLKQD